MITDKQAACAAAASEDLVKGFEWDDNTIAAGVKVIDIAQALVLPWIKRLNPKLGAYVEIGLQTIEDALRKMLPNSAT